jgi:hypothetical protein
LVGWYRYLEINIKALPNSPKSENFLSKKVVVVVVVVVKCYFMTNLLKKTAQYQINLERIRGYEKFIIRENNFLGYYSFGGNPQPHSEPAKIASREKNRLEGKNRDIVRDLAS